MKRKRKLEVEKRTSDEGRRNLEGWIRKRESEKRTIKLNGDYYYY